MKHVLLYLFCFLLSLTPASAAIAPADTAVQTIVTTTQATGDNPEDVEFNMFLFAIASCAAVMILAGLVMVLVAAGLLLALITAGVASVSVIAGLRQRSLKAGFRFFVLSMASLAGMAGGAGICFLVNRITHWYSTEQILIFGILLGAGAGWLCGRFALYILGKLASYARSRIS